MKVIPDEEIVSQHCLLLMDFVFKMKIRGKVKSKINLNCGV